MKKVIKRNWLFWTYFLGFGVFFSRAWSIALFMDGVGLRSGWIASWADGAAHLSYMSAFAYRNIFPTTHPLFIGKPFSYPFVVDMLGGILVKMGLPLHVSYNLLGLFLSMFLVVMVWKLFSKMFKNEVVSFLGSLVFFLGAGLTNLEKFVGFPYKQMFDTYDWVDIISAQIMPQRALILGMPLGVLIYLVIFDYFKNKKISKLKLALVGLLTGLMSIIHAHTLIALFFLVGWLFVMDVYKNKQIRGGWWWYGLPAMVLGGLILFRQAGSFDTTFIRFLPLWLVESKNENLLWFWIKSWGIWPIVAYMGYSGLKKNRRVLFLSLLLLFVLLNLFSFQPYDWDNTKLFSWIYLFFSGVVGVGLVNIWKKKKWIAVFCFMLMTFSGTIDASKLMKPQDDPVLYLFTHEDIKLAEKIKSDTDFDSVFLTSNYHLNPIPVLTGRQILMGYPGWLWTYGIDYSSRLNEVEIMFAGGINSEELMSKYGVNYVVFDDVVMGSVKEANEEYFIENYLRVFESNKYRVYEVRD